MYFCEKCRAKNHWPIGMLNSHGVCEVCGEITDCYDKAVSALPSSLKEAMERERISAINEAKWENERK